jgi:hypothetical protein
MADVTSFNAGAADIAKRLKIDTDSRVRVFRGVEVRSNGDLTLASDWNLYSPTRTTGQAGWLTLRAAGNLLLSGTLSDGFDGTAPTSALKARDSWSYRLVAGADLSSANPIGVMSAPAAGDITLGAGKLVRTGVGSIELAAANNVLLGSNSSAIYTAGALSGPLTGFTPPPSTVYSSGGGDVSIVAGGDIEMLGTPVTQGVNDWLFRLASNGQTTWWVSFRDFRQNVGALGGGNVRLSAGGDILNVSAAVPTNARILVPDPNKSSLVQGGGNLDVYAGGDVVGGLYFVGRGVGNIVARGSILTSGETGISTALALADGNINVRAGSDITLSSVFNPTLLPQGNGNVLSASATNVTYFSTYAPTSSVNLTSINGNIMLANNAQIVSDVIGTGLRLPSGSDHLPNYSVYPGSLSAIALQGSVDVSGDQQSLVLYPSAVGNLEILAAHDVNLAQAIYMADVAPATLPGVSNPSKSVPPAPGGGANWFGIDAHAATPLHAADPATVRIYALDGNIAGVATTPTLYLAKAASLKAGNDVSDVWLNGQNLTSADVTSIEAGHDIYFSTPPGPLVTSAAGVFVGGPGALELTAGRNIDLGISSGIASRGNLDNPALPDSGARITVTTGLGRNAAGELQLPAIDAFVNVYVAPVTDDTKAYRTDLVAYMTQMGQPDLTADEAVAAFRALSTERQLPFVAGVLYSELKAGGTLTPDGRHDYARGYDAISTLFAGTGYSGDLLLYLSQIKSARGGGIQILVPGGLVNEGLANPPAGLTKTPSELGIVTVEGGSIDAFAHGDFQVNQSRVFTLRGGDILIWSSTGDIDAGKGSKNLAYVQPPTLITNPDGSVQFDYNSAASGSGIAVLLTDPSVAPGRVDLIAPNGFVDAGEAGIRSVGDVNIAALQVFNASNIQAGGLTTGVPVAIDTAALSLGIVGASNLAASAGRGLDAAASASTAAATMANAAAPAVPTNFVSVEVLGYGEKCKPGEANCGGEQKQ